MQVVIAFRSLFRFIVSSTHRAITENQLRQSSQNFRPLNCFLVRLNRFCRDVQISPRARPLPLLTSSLLTLALFQSEVSLSSAFPVFVFNIRRDVLQ